MDTVSKQIDQLIQAFDSPLPGQKAQRKMAPPGRNLSIGEKERIKLKQSAVLLLLWEEKDELHLVFTVRPDTMRNHPGQISFPGGGFEPDDINLFETAFRETEEEIGVSRSEYKILGKLTPLYVSVSNYCIQPVVAFAEQRPNFDKNDSEVAELLTLPIGWFQNKNNLNEFQAHTKTGILTVPSYPVGEKQLWGATAMILNELLEMIQ